MGGTVAAGLVGPGSGDGDDVAAGLVFLGRCSLDARPTRNKQTTTAEKQTMALCERINVAPPASSRSGHPSSARRPEPHCIRGAACRVRGSSPKKYPARRSCERQAAERTVVL